MKTPQEAAKELSPFEIDLTNHRFNIIIKVKQNIHEFDIEWVNEKPGTLSYQEVVGILEIVKSGFLRNHSELVRKSKLKKPK